MANFPGGLITKLKLKASSKPPTGFGGGGGELNRGRLVTDYNVVYNVRYYQC